MTPEKNYSAPLECREHKALNCWVGVQVHEGFADDNVDICYSYAALTTSTFGGVIKKSDEPALVAKYLRQVADHADMVIRELQEHSARMRRQADEVEAGGLSRQAGGSGVVVAVEQVNLFGEEAGR